MGSGAIWVLLPTVNERRNLAVLLPHLLKIDLSWRILVIDDGSTDGTVEFLTDLAERQDRLRFLHGNERGLGAALRKGMLWACRQGASRIVTMDADASHDPETIPDLLARDEDLVLGSRYVNGGRVLGWSRRRKAISFVANRFSRFSLGASERDITTGFRAYTRDMVEIVLKNSMADGYNCQVEAGDIAKKHRKTIAEVPITFRERLWGESKLSTRKEASHLVRMLATKSPLRLFLVVALIASLINEVLLVGLVGLFRVHYLTAGVIAVESAILTSFLLNEKWTFRGRVRRVWALRLARYNATVFGGLLLNLLVLFLLTEYGNLLYLFSNVFAMGTAVSWNYVLGGFLARRL